MSGITLAQAETLLAEFLAGISAVLAGKEYRIGNRWYRREDMPALLEGAKWADALVKRLARGGGIRITGGTPT